MIPKVKIVRVTYLGPDISVIDHL